MALTESPYLLYSDGEGNIFEDETLYVVGRAGWDAYPIPTEDWIVLPYGGNLYELPGRRGIGIDVETGESINLFAENLKEDYENLVSSYFEKIKTKCLQYRIQYVPVEIGKNFEKILLTYLTEKQKFG